MLPLDKNFSGLQGPHPVHMIIYSCTFNLVMLFFFLRETMARKAKCSRSSVLGSNQGRKQISVYPIGDRYCPSSAGCQDKVRLFFFFPLFFLDITKNLSRMPAHTSSLPPGTELPGWLVVVHGSTIMYRRPPGTANPS